MGKFIGCSTYPECTHTEPLLERLGIACPVCGEAHGGEIVVRRSKRGRTFFGCSRFPDCSYTSWKKPLPQRCVKCGGLVVQNSRTNGVCTLCGTIQPIETHPETASEPA